MAATYNVARTTDTDLVRAALGDTDVSPATNALFQDEEIAAVLASTGSVNAAVMQLAFELVIRLSRKPVVIKAGDVSVDYSERIPGYRELAAGGIASSAASSLSFVTANYTGDAATDEYSRAPWWW